MVAAAAAVFLRNGETEKSELAEPRHNRWIDRFGAIPFRCVRGDLAVDEVGGHALCRCLFIGQFQVHRNSKKTNAESFL